MCAVGDLYPGFGFVYYRDILYNKEIGMLGGGGILNEPGILGFPFMPDLKEIAEQNNLAFKGVFKGRIKGYFLIDIKERVMKSLRLENLVKYYDFHCSDARMVTGIGEAVEYDICRMIVGIHRAYSVFLSDNEIRKNEKSKRYKQWLRSIIIVVHCEIEEIKKIFRLCLYKVSVRNGRCFFNGRECFHVPGERCIFAGGAGEYPALLMDGVEYYGGYGL